MLMYGESIKNTLIASLEKNRLAIKQKQNWITNKYLTLILELEFVNDSIIEKVLNAEFTEEELEEYSKNYLTKEFRGRFGREQIRRISQRTGVNTNERKEEYKKRVFHLKSLLLSAIDGNEKAYEDFENFYESYVFDKNEKENIGMKKFIPVGILISISRDKKNPINLEQMEKGYLKNLNYTSAKYLISDLKYELGCLLGFKKRKDTYTLINNFKDIINYSTEIDDEDEETLESIKLSREQYKSSLSLIQKKFEEVENELKEERERIATEEIKEFFVSLNSAKYGNFLDKIPLTEELLKEIRKKEQEYNLPQDVKKILMFIKLVIKFIKDKDITPIEEINRVFLGTAEDIAEMDYSGEAFLNDEIKKLRIVASGYKYKELIISIPKVEEVKE